MRNRLLPIRPRLIRINQRNRIRVLLRTGEVDRARVPEEVLEELVGVLLLDNLAGGFDDVAGILDEALTGGGELDNDHGGIVANVAEGFVYLGVVGVAAVAQGLDDAVEAEPPRRRA